MNTRKHVHTLYTHAHTHTHSYADLKSSTCRWCPAGAFGPNTTGNERCLACPANT